jgi:alkylhydroperoxidase/carboxymuconolactone decarboxylase family protein YurZ
MNMCTYMLAAPTCAPALHTAPPQRGSEPVGGTRHYATRRLCPRHSARLARARPPPRVSPSLAQLNGPLFQGLWRPQDLTPRDRSPVTIVALTAKGDADQLGFHLKRGIENGLTHGQLGETMAHLAFYAGWTKAISGTTAIAKLDAPAKP